MASLAELSALQAANVTLRRGAHGAFAFQRTAVVFLLLGMILGVKMGMTEDFTLAPVHTHLNLEGRWSERAQHWCC